MNASNQSERIVLPARDLRGSRLRFLMLTSCPREQVADTLTELASPWASVDPDDYWMPKGFRDAEEAKLGDCEHFLFTDRRRQLTEWWLKITDGANTPNWDLASTCKFGDKMGLILVEGKAHAGELEDGGKRPGNAENNRQIESAIGEASKALNDILPGWKLSTGSHYQLCNRFAWAWKVASLGLPVVLIYLGFLHATEMPKTFSSPEEWKSVVREHAGSVVPSDAWERPLQTSGAPMYASIRSLDLQWSAGRAG